MGSQSDWPNLRHAAETLDALKIDYEARIVSAHRTPERMYRFRQGRPRRRLQGDHRRAGGAAHLPGMIAALTPLPVLGVPVETKALGGQDSLLSIVQMPPGIPVGTLAIGRAGAINAALLAAAILALNDPDIADALDDFRARTRPTSIAEFPNAMTDILPCRRAAPSAFSAAASSAACWRSPPPGWA